MESQLQGTPPGRYMSTRIGDGVLYGEWYIKVDRDGDGIAENWSATSAPWARGSHHRPRRPGQPGQVRACSAATPISHTIVRRLPHPRRVTFRRHPECRYKTNMMRGSPRFPRREHQSQERGQRTGFVDMDDAQNDDNGAIIRVRGNPGDAISYVTTPFAGQQALFPSSTS